MGWNSWNALGPGVTAAAVREHVDAMVGAGMRAAGYEYVVIDDCWMAPDLDGGDLVPDPERFPDGIAPLADYAHDRGLKLGLYSSAGTETCQGLPGSIGRERRHAEQFAAWGVDYLKYDNCGDHLGRDAVGRYAAMGRALEAVDREVVYSICEWGENAPWRWGRNAGGHLWRTTGDVVPTWRTGEDEFGLGVADALDRAADRDLAPYGGPGGWNDPDMLAAGVEPTAGQWDEFDVEVGGLSEAEARTQFAAWCLLAAPLMAGNDLRAMGGATRDLLTNEGAIAIGQDPLGIRGTRDRTDGGAEVWSRRLSGGEGAVLLLNRGEVTARIDAAIDGTDVPGEADRYRAREVFTGVERTVAGTIGARVEPHDAALFRVAPA